MEIILAGAMFFLPLLFLSFIIVVVTALITKGKNAFSDPTDIIKATFLLAGGWFLYIIVMILKEVGKFISQSF